MSRKEILVILGIALALRLVFLVVACQDPQARQLTADSGMYLTLGQHLAEGKGFWAWVQEEPDESAVWAPELCRTPGYPVALAVLDRLTGHRQLAITTLQSLLGVSLCAGVMLACGHLLGRPAGLVAGVLMALDVQGSALASMVMTESSYGVGLGISALTTAWAVHTRSPGRAVPAGLLLGLTTLIRPTSVYLPVVFGVCWLVWAMRSRCRASMLAACLFALSAGLVTGAWTVRNGVVCGEYTISSISRFNLLGYHAGSTLARAKGIPFGRARDQLCRELGYSKTQVRRLAMSAADRSRLFRLALGTLWAHPRAFVTEYGLRTTNIWFGPDKLALWVLGLPLPDFGLLESSDPQVKHPGFPTWGILGYQLLWMATVYLLCLWTLVQTIRGRQFPGLVYVALAFAAYILLLQSGAPGDPRLRWPAIPLLVIVAAASLRRVHPAGEGTQGGSTRAPLPSRRGTMVEDLRGS